MRQILQALKSQNTRDICPFLLDISDGACQCIKLVGSNLHGVHHGLLYNRFVLCKSLLSADLQPLLELNRVISVLYQCHWLFL